MIGERDGSAAATLRGRTVVERCGAIYKSHCRQPHDELPSRDVGALRFTPRNDGRCLFGSMESIV
jgi:hypothetical protein